MMFNGSRKYRDSFDERVMPTEKSRTALVRRHMKVIIVSLILFSFSANSSKTMEKVKKKLAKFRNSMP